MAKNYRIRVEALDGAESVIPEKWEKNTCEGFVLLIYDGNHWSGTIQNVTRLEMAQGIAQSDDLVEAGMNAQAMVAAEEHHTRHSAEFMRKQFTIPLDKNGNPKSR